MDLMVNVAEEHIKYAQECLTMARIALVSGNFRSSVNRSYYCAFNCAQALIAGDGVSYKKHSAVIGHFNKNFIHTGILDAKLYKIISRLFDDRNVCDYDMGHSVAEEDVAARIDDAAYFLEEVKKHLKIL